MKNLPEIKKVLNLIVNETDDLKRLERRVNEIIIEDIMKDSILYPAEKVTTPEFYIYEVDPVDYYHIISHIDLIQRVLLPDVGITASHSGSSYRVLFKVFERE